MPRTGSAVMGGRYSTWVGWRAARDNLKSGVTKAHRYEPKINPAYMIASGAGMGPELN